MFTRRIICGFPQEVIQEPLLYNLAKDFNVIPNIRGASITESQGSMQLELQGEAEEINRVISYLRERGVTVDDLEEDAAAD